MSGNNPVFDYVPRGMPVIQSDAMENEMDRVLQQVGMSADTANKATDAYRDVEVREFRNNPEFVQEVHDAFQESGVNLISPTVGRGRINNPVQYGERVRQHLARWQARIDELEWLVKANSPTDAKRIVDNGNVGVVLNMQNIGVEVFDDLSELERLKNFGVQIMQLTYNTQNLIGSSGSERVDGGLSEHGVDVVHRLNDLDLVIDLSHCGTETIFDTTEYSNAPVACTHTMSEEISGHERGKTDEELQAIASVDGYVGITILPRFLAPNNVDEASDRFFDHLDRIIEIVGIDNVGIGTDWGRWTAGQPERLQPYIEAKYGGSEEKIKEQSRTGLAFGEMKRYADWQVIPKGLADYGYTESEIEGITGINFVKFWDRVVQ